MSFGWRRRILAANKEVAMIHTGRLGRFVLIPGVIYLVILVAVSAGAAVAFRDLYSERPYDALATLSEEYRSFLRIGGAGLALYIGIWAGAFGAWRKNPWHGLAILAAGTAATLLALSPLPWVRFPFDRYAAPAAWIFGSAVPLLFGWAVATVAGLQARQARE
jgi:hypothetical protein